MGEGNTGDSAAELLRVATATTETLTRLYDEIGVGEQERAEDLAALQRAVVAVFEGKISEQEALRASLMERLEAVNARVAQVAAVVGAPAPAPVSSAGPNLREALRGAEEVERELELLRDERAKELSGHFSSLYARWKQLGGNENDAFAVQFDTLVICGREDREADLSQAHIAEYVAALETANAECERRAKMADELCCTIAELWDELDAAPAGPNAAGVDDIDRRVLATAAGNTSADHVASGNSNTSTSSHNTSASSSSSSSATGSSNNGSAASSATSSPRSASSASAVQRHAAAAAMAGLSTPVLSQIEARVAELEALKTERVEQVQALAKEISALWDLLEVEDEAREDFFARNTGLGRAVIAACEEELAQRNTEKHAKLEELVMVLRERLAAVWDELATDEADRRAQFPDAFAEDGAFTDESLEAHETFLGRLEDRLAAAGPVLQLIGKREEFLAELAELDAVRDDPDRLKSRKAGANVLRETRQREKIGRLLPKLEAKLGTLLANWEADYEEAFMFEGRNVLAEIAESERRKAEEEEARKREFREKQLARKAALGLTSGGSTAKRGAAAPRKTVGGTGAAGVRRTRTVSSTASAANSTGTTTARRTGGATGATAASRTRKIAAPSPGKTRAALSPRNASRIARREG